MKFGVIVIVMIIFAPLAVSQDTRPLVNFCDTGQITEGFYRDNGSLMSLGTATRIGDVWVTNYHVVDQCLDKVVAHDAVMDIAILNRGDPGSCEVPDDLSGPAFARGSDYDEDTGIVWQKMTRSGRYVNTVRSDLVEWVRDENGEFVLEPDGRRKTTEPVGHFNRIAITQSEYTVVPGFSGGKMFVVRDGQEITIGVLNSSNETGVYGIPIDDVCRLIATVKP